MSIRFHVDAIQKIAKAHHLEDPTESVPAFNRFLEWWWCCTYNRPLKDPILKEYTPDELLYEFLRHFYAKPENDPRRELEEKAKALQDEEWIKSMLAKEPAPDPGHPPASSGKKPKKAKSRGKKKKVQPEPDLPEISTQFESNDQ